MIKLLFAILLLVAASARAGSCWNPFGCEPKTYQQCVEQASDSKTDVAAKALIAQCDRFKVTEPVCVADAKSFKEETLHPNPKTAEIRKKYPAFANLDDEQIADALHQVYYPDMTVGQIEAGLGVTPHPDRSNCHRFYEQLYK